MATKKSRKRKEITIRDEHSAHIGNTDQNDYVLEELDEFRKTGQFTDVVIKCGDVSINAHKNVLAAASPYFLAMFSGNFPESTQHEVELKETDAVALKLAIDYIYTRSMMVPDDCVVRLFETATFLQLDELVEQCALFMTKYLTKNHNCLSIKSLAEKYDNEFLMNFTHNYLFGHFKEVVNCDEFVELRHDQLTCILKSDKLYVHSDEVIMNSLVRWVEHDQAERMPKMAELLTFINPSIISAEVAREQPLLQQEEARAGEFLRAVVEGRKGPARMWRIFALTNLERDPALVVIDLGKRGAMHEERNNGITSFKAKPILNPGTDVSLCAFKNVVYMQGGCSGHNPYKFATLNRNLGCARRDSSYYNISRDEWYTLEPMLLERSHHRSLVLGDSLYALAGHGLQGVTAAVECRSLITDKSVFRESMTHARYAMGAVAYENALYVVGGETEFKYLYSMERYDPRVGVWQELPSMHQDLTCKQRHYHSAAVIDSEQQIYCCTEYANSMDRFDLRANKWQTIRFGANNKCQEIFNVDNVLYCLSQSKLYRYDLLENRWTIVYISSNMYWGWITGVSLPSMKDNSLEIF